MQISSRMSLVLLLVLGMCLDSGESTKAHRKRVVRKTRKSAFQSLNQPKSGRAFQVLNEPKGGQTITKPIPKPEPPPPRTTTTTTTTAPTSTKAGTKRLSPLLDFPEYDDTPLLDFPDPLDAELRRKYAGYDTYCKTEWMNQQKGLAAIANRTKQDEVLHETETQNRRLKQALVNNAITADPVPEHDPILGFKLLDLSAEIFQSMCPTEYVPDYFVTNALYAFKKLHFMTSSDRTEKLLNQEQFQWISGKLSQCLSNGTNRIVYFPDPKCRERILAYQKKEQWLCTDWQHDFNKRLYDPLLDVIWHIYNAVHNYCFPFFEDDKNVQMLHLYGAVVLDLYSTPIRQRWRFQIENREFWDMVLGPYHEHYFRNMERCAHAPAKLYLKGVRLPRYFTIGSVRFDEKVPNDPFNKP